MNHRRRPANGGIEPLKPLERLEPLERIEF